MDGFSGCQWLNSKDTADCKAHLFTLMYNKHLKIEIENAMKRSQETLYSVLCAFSLYSVLCAFILFESKAFQKRMLFILQLPTP